MHLKHAKQTELIWWITRFCTRRNVPLEEVERELHWRRVQLGEQEIDRLQRALDDAVADWRALLGEHQGQALSQWPGDEQARGRKIKRRITKAAVALREASRRTDRCRETYFYTYIRARSEGGGRHV